MSELKTQVARKSHNEGNEKSRPPQPTLEFEKQVDGILERIEKIETMLGIVEKGLQS